MSEGLELERLRSLRQKRLPVDLKLCNSVLSSFAQGEQWRRSSNFLEQISSWHVKPDAVSLSIAFSAMTRERPWQHAIHLLESLESAPDRILLNSLMLLLPWRRALHLLQSMPERTIQADHVTYNAALNALDSPGNWQLALNLLASMKRQRLLPDQRNWNTAMKVCGHCGQWQWTLALFQQLAAPNNVSFITAISACPTAQWRLALELLGEATHQNVVDLGTSSATLQVLATSGHWQISLDLLSRRRDWRDFDVAQVLKSAFKAGRQDIWPMISALKGQRLSYNTVLEEFRELGQWQKCLDLLSAMIASRVPPDEYSYGLCIGSCNTAGAWQLALRLLGVMPARMLTPQLKTYQVAAVVCANGGQWQAVLRLVEMLDPTHRNQVVSQALEVCALRGHSRAAAELAVATTGAEEEVRSRFLMAMQSCVSGREWPLIMGLFEQLPQVRVTTNGILKELVQPFTPGRSTDGQSQNP